MRKIDQQVKLYKLNKEHWELKTQIRCHDKIYFIIDRHRKLVEKFDEVTLPVPHLYFHGLHYYLYNFEIPSFTSVWKKFFPKALTQGQEFISQTPSFVLFIHDKENIFALVGGHGHHAVKRYFDISFGLKIMSRLINPSIDTVHLVKTRGITGNIAGKTEFYRNNQKILDIPSFGKIFKEILFELNLESIEDNLSLNIKDDKKKKLLAHITKGFQLKLGIDFKQLNQLIQDCIALLKKKPNIELGTFVPIIDEEYIQKSINYSLFKTLKQRIDAKIIESGSMSFLDYDFCHPEKMQEFYEADMYQVFERKRIVLETDDRNSIFENTIDSIRNDDNISSLPEVMSFLGRIKVRSIKEGEETTIAPFMTHLSCEIVHKGVNHFKIDNQWYTIEKNFTHELNITCKAFFKDYGIENIIAKTWINPNEKKYSEDWYNMQYKNEKNHLVLDKILGQNIELCDILLYDENKIYLVHVKGGFNGKMRDLTNQIKIAARRLWLDLRTKEKDFLKEIHTKLIKKEDGRINDINWDDFLELFNKKIVFVLAFASFNKKKRKVFKQVELFTSNIAKFSIVETVKEMRDQEYQLLIKEIHHEFK